MATDDPRTPNPEPQLNINPDEVHLVLTGLEPEPQLNINPDEVHLVLTGLELDIIVDALRSVGNVELAERLESVLRRLGQNHTSR